MSRPNISDCEIIGILVSELNWQITTSNVSEDYISSVERQA